MPTRGHSKQNIKNSQQETGSEKRQWVSVIHEAVQAGVLTDRITASHLSSRWRCIVQSEMQSSTSSVWSSTIIISGADFAFRLVE